MTILKNDEVRQAIRCPKSQEVQALNGQTVVSTARYLGDALTAANYEKMPTIVVYDGRYHVTIPTAPKGYRCSDSRCYC